MYKYGPTYTSYFPLHRHILIYPYMDTYIPTFIYLYGHMYLLILHTHILFYVYTRSSIYKHTTPNSSVASIATYYNRRLPLPTTTIYYHHPLNYLLPPTSTTTYYYRRYLPLRLHITTYHQDSLLSTPTTNPYHLLLTPSIPHDQPLLSLILLPLHITTNYY